ncbi:magnesium-translocating P-type ATPase [Bacillus cereus]|uniref:Magnesium-transporting ATPase, P-type 1 n=4 Tax=Bacillus TaxID=1386 RepID=A0A9X6XYN6_BACCE|nr:MULTISPECIES: magnesium-translocating P-type ATPase [Bacillus]KAF6690390.1 magnesium-translocating P-type ATPase [Bacillus sp. EKM501B]MEB9547382.1 magnesium-translocating P-type ATPase [Bacillus cereus]MEB9834261.1 magnesium-translocating P-type ATPase [Bacillus cereus]MEB9844561.1 magnesium-translocating P-type ATPase [Bacillus cereus]MEC0073118.1 magnesium-translocating P-type ATPase [Bacillus cereus]
MLRSNKKYFYKQEVLSKNYNMLIEIAKSDVESTLDFFKTTSQGLSHEEATKRLEVYGENKVVSQKRIKWYITLFNSFRSPFISLLIILGMLSFFTNDIKGTIIVGIMVTLSVLIRFIQEIRSQKSIERLKNLVYEKVTVLRKGNIPYKENKRTLLEESGKVQIGLENLVPGDIIELSAGNIVPADVRIISSENLLVNQSSLTGEALPVEKSNQYFHMYKKRKIRKIQNLIELENLCFMGTHIISGTAKVIVVGTGTDTYFGSIAKNQVKLNKKFDSEFDRGVSKVSWLLIKFMIIMTPIVMIIHGGINGNWYEAFLFAIAIAIGLTPEMLPMIVTANLAKGSINMSKKKVLVKQLSSIHNLGAMDILCIDKTGTLTENKMDLVRYTDTNGEKSDEVLRLAYINSYFHTNYKNEIDLSVIRYVKDSSKYDLSQYSKIDECLFDFDRRRVSVVIEKNANERIMLCKGAVREVVSICSFIKENNKIIPMTDEIQRRNKHLIELWQEQGMRVVAVAYKQLNSDKVGSYSINDESDMILVGYVGFLNPPKQSAIAALHTLQKKGVQVKILTGDNESVTRNVCRKMGLYIGEPVLGYEIDSLPDKVLGKLASKTSVFAKLNPSQKFRIIKALQINGHTVGFMGDGINDVFALKQSDVGVSIHSADDIVKESSDIILIEKDLHVLEDAIVEGRTTFGNILKYIKMTASSNFGNVLSLLIASAFLPFLPMLPIQILCQNLLYNLSQLSIPWDKVDNEFLVKPRSWDTKDLFRFIIFIGPVSSVFDIIIFIVMWNVFGANIPEMQSLFQTGWFVVGLLTQLLIVHMIRTQHIPFLQSTAARPVLILTGLVMFIGISLPFTSLSTQIGLTPLPFYYFLWLLGILTIYALVTQFIKRIYIRKFNRWL